MERVLKKLETEMKLRGFSPQTQRMYLFYTRKFMEYIDKEEVEEEDVKEYLAYMISKGVSNASIALIKAVLNFFLKEVLGKKVSNIKTPKVAKKLP